MWNDNDRGNRNIWRACRVATSPNINPTRMTLLRIQPKVHFSKSTPTKTFGFQKFDAICRTVDSPAVRIMCHARTLQYLMAVTLKKTQGRSSGSPCWCVLLGWQSSRSHVRTHCACLHCIKHPSLYLWLLTALTSLFSSKMYSCIRKIILELTRAVVFCVAETYL
jgi:hypothetical protein